MVPQVMPSNWHQIGWSTTRLGWSYLRLPKWLNTSLCASPAFRSDGSVIFIDFQTVFPADVSVKEVWLGSMWVVNGKFQDDKKMECFEHFNRKHDIKPFLSTLISYIIVDMLFPIPYATILLLIEGRTFKLCQPWNSGCHGWAGKSFENHIAP